MSGSVRQVAVCCDRRCGTLAGRRSGASGGALADDARGEEAESVVVGHAVQQLGVRLEADVDEDAGERELGPVPESYALDVLTAEDLLEDRAAADVDPRVPELALPVARLGGQLALALEHDDLRSRAGERERLLERRVA